MCKEIQNLLPGGFQAALLEIGLAASPAVQGFGHFLIQLPQVFPAGETVAVAVGIAAGESGDQTVTMAADGGGQFPQFTAVQGIFEMQHPTLACVVLGDGGKQPVTEGGGSVFHRGQGLIDLLGGSAGLQDLGGEGLGYLSVLLENILQQPQRPVAAAQLNADTLMKFYAGKDLDQADLTGSLDVDTAAGAAVV